MVFNNCCVTPMNITFTLRDYLLTIHMHTPNTLIGDRFIIFVLMTVVCHTTLSPNFKNDQLINVRLILASKSIEPWNEKEFNNFISKTIFVILDAMLSNQFLFSIMCLSKKLSMPAISMPLLPSICSNLKLTFSANNFEYFELLNFEYYL